MANNNVPAHDFAPSWLKIPAYDSTSKNAHTDGAYATRREEHRPQRRISGGRAHFGHSDGHRDWEGHLVGSGRPFFISRHHSLDVEEGHHPGVPPPLHPPPHVDVLAPPRRPHSRHDFRDFQPSYQKVNCGSQAGDGCSFPVLKSGTSNKTEGNRKDLASNNFNQEFPTLQGNSEAPFQPSITNGSVWENPRNSKVHGTVLKKVHLFQRPLRNDSHVESRSKSPSSVAANSPLSSGGPVSPKLVRHVTCQPVKPAPLTGGSAFKTLTPAKKNQQPHTMEILVKHPKTKGNKGDFLKALKSGDDSKEEDISKGDGEAGENCTVNGDRQRNESLSEDARSEEFDDSAEFSKLSLDNSSMNTPLSSSLEAEQRLLREMGWKEEALDDDVYAPLTEDELREYQNLTKLRQAKQRNGTTQRPQLWSPLRVAPPLTVACAATALLNGTGRWSSSSSDSSDSDSN